MKRLNATRQILPIALTGLMLVLLSACGSTKVVTAGKTIVYRDSMYAMANVESFSGRLQATTPAGENIDVNGFDKAAIRDLLKQHGTVTLRSAIMFDDREVVYEQTNVDSYRAFDKVQNNLQSALNKVRKFMADPQKTQLQL